MAPCWFMIPDRPRILTLASTNPGCTEHTQHAAHVAIKAARTPRHPPPHNVKLMTYCPPHTWRGVYVAQKTCGRHIQPAIPANRVAKPTGKKGGAQRVKVLKQRSLGTRKTRTTLHRDCIASAPVHIVKHGSYRAHPQVDARRCSHLPPPVPRAPGPQPQGVVHTRCATDKHV